MYPDGPDPVTGGQQIAQLAFEVVSTQILGQRDPERLGRWIARAIACTPAAQLLVEP